MRAAIVIASVALIALATGCGELQNRPLRHGDVRGKVERPEPELGYVALLGLDEEGEIEDSEGLEDDGAFHLDEILSGTYDLVVVANANEAAILRGVQVVGGEVTDLGVVALADAASLTVTLRTPSGQRLHDAVVWLQGFPLPAYEVEDERPVADILGLPAACYEVRGYVRGLGERAQAHCLEPGDLEAFELVLPEPDGSAGREGCSVTGCVEGLSCRSDGRCAP